MSDRRQLVERLTETNWRRSERQRWAAGMLMRAHIEEVEEGYQVVYGAPDRGMGSRDTYASLANALEWANLDLGGIMLTFEEDDRVNMRWSSPPQNP